MNGMAELITIKRYWSEWKDPRLIIAILHNNDLNQVTWEMRAMAGAPKFAESQNLPDIDFAAFAASLGLNAMTIKDPEELSDAWRNALSADRPTVLDVHTDPHATWEQFKSATTAVLSGDEDRVGFVKVGLKTKAQEFLPHKKS
jgi:pyruvate dehydrogenase (quinone)